MLSKVVICFLSWTELKEAARLKKNLVCSFQSLNKLFLNSNLEFQQSWRSVSKPTANTCFTSEGLSQLPSLESADVFRVGCRGKGEQDQRRGTDTCIEIHAFDN